MHRRSLLAGVATGLLAVLAPGGQVLAADAEPPPPPETAAGEVPAPPPPDPAGGEAVAPPMRDGVKLAASLWRPDGAGPFPTILMLAMNRRRDADPAALPLLGELRAAGYAVVAADLRGRWRSEGVFDPADQAQHGRDGCDLVEWIAAQAWCDGQVGALGQGAAAAALVAAALQAPPHLKALALWGGGFSTAEPVEGAPAPAAGGALRLLDLLGEAADDVASDLARMAAQGQDVSAARQALAELLARPRATYDHLPLLEAPVLQVAPFRQRAQARLAAAAAPPGPPAPYERLALPIFHVCGWYDPAAWTQVAAFEALRQRAGSAAAREGQRLVVGPWPSAMTFGRRLGEMGFGAAADSAGAGVNARQIAFFDQHLRGRGAQLSPVRYFLMGADAWRDAPSWPPPGTERRRLYLRSGGKANSVAGDGVLSRKGPVGDPADHFVYDPLAPAPTVGGALAGPLAAADLQPGPMEQTPVEKRVDVLCYTSPPFEAGVEICGPATLRLHVSTSAIDTDFTARLTQVYPDGASVNLCEAALRLSGRDLARAPQPVAPGEVCDLMLGLGQVAAQIPAGHRLRLQVSSSNFPLFDRNMNDAAPPGTGASGAPATQTVHHRAGRASCLELPIAPARPPA